MPGHYAKASGAATLTMTILLLLVTTLFTLYTMNTSVFEQNISGNQYRADQALAAAQAGLDAAIDRYNRFDTVTPVLTPAQFTGSVGTAFYRVSFCNTSAWPSPTAAAAVISPGTCASLSSFANMRHIGIVSEGFSDDRSGYRVITQIAAGGSVLEPGGGPFSPVLSRSSVGVTGNITVINRYSNTTVWSGGPAGMGSNSVETLINDGSLSPSNPATYTRPNLTTLSKTGGDYNYAELASKNNLGMNSDVRDNDQKLKNMSAAELFNAHFSATKEAVREMAVGLGQQFSSISTSTIVNTGKTGLIWIDGNQSYSGGGGGGAVIGSAIGSTVMVIDGDLTINGGTIYGLVFVNGTVDFGGNVVISGGIISTDKIYRSGGSPVIVYDPEAFGDKPEGMSGLRSGVAGTWKDWQL